MAVKVEAQKRHLSKIAEDIDEDWPSPNYAAVPYLDAMRELRMITDAYFEDSAEMVVRYFLNNAKNWKGDTARRVKAELKAMLK
jgi:hypothetical protein